MSINRQEFLKSIALGGLATALSTEGVTQVMAQTGASANGKPIDLVAVMGGEPVEMLEAGLKPFGGIERFVKSGQKIVIKPNIGWDKTPELAGNTNPQLVAALVKLCLEAGASEVTVFDHTCDDWRRCYRTSEIEAAAKAAGAKVMPGNEEEYYREVALPRGKELRSAKIHQALLECDAWFNVPILKNHGGANMTIAMKNLMGIVWDRRFFHTHDLHQCIADICTYEKMPVLNIVDAYRVMKSNGPRGRSLNDVVTPQGMFLSPDIVAVDTAATRFFNQIVSMPLEDVGYLAKGQSLDVGTMDLKTLNIRRVKI